MKKTISAFSVLLLTMALIGAKWPAAETSTDKMVGTDIPFENITDFYYTYDASTATPRYQRYRFYTEDGRHCFDHETREGGGWPQTEADVTCAGTLELTDGQWGTFCDLLNGGIARTRKEVLEDGAAGPWLFIYWTGGEMEGREFAFDPPGNVLAFEAFCAGLRAGTR